MPPFSDRVDCSSHLLMPGWIARSTFNRSFTGAARVWPFDGLAQLEAAWDQELMELASQRVQLRIAPKTWNAFQLSAVERLRGEEVAERLQMNLASVYKAKSNVLKLLQQEVQSLERSEFA